MSLVGKLIGFCFRQAIGNVAGDEAGQMAGTVAGSVIQVVEKHFSDNSSTLPTALARANDRAWQAVSIALTGHGLLDKIKGFFASGDYKGIREQVRLFLQDKTIGYEGTPVDFRKNCLSELNQAKKAGLLTFQNASQKDVPRQTADFQRFANPRGMIEGAGQVMEQIVNDLGDEYPNLGKLLRQPTPGDGPPLLVAAFAYFFRREVETNAELHRGLVFDELRHLSVAQDKAFGEVHRKLISYRGLVFGGLRQLSASQERAFDEVNKALISMGDQFDQVFEQLCRIETVVKETQRAVGQTHDAVLGLQEQVKGQSELIQIRQAKTHDVLLGVKSDVSDFKDEMRRDKEARHRRARYKTLLRNSRGNLGKQKLDRAITAATEAIQIDPGSVHAYHARAKAYLLRGQYDQAIADATTAIQIDQKDAHAYRIRAEAYVKKFVNGEDDEAIEHDYNQAIADATDAIRNDHEDAHAYRIRAEAYLDKGVMQVDEYEDLYDRAIPDANKAVRLAPHNDDNHCTLAEAYLLKEDYGKAIASAKEAIRINAASEKAHEILADVYSDRANAHLSKGAFDQAIADYTEVIRLDPESVDAYLARANAHLRKGDFDKVIVDASEAIRLDPQSAWAYYTRANAHVRNGNIVQANNDSLKGLLRQEAPDPQLNQLFNETWQAINAALPPGPTPAPAALLPTPAGKTVPVSGFTLASPDAYELYSHLKKLGGVWHSARNIWDVPEENLSQALALSPKLTVAVADTVPPDTQSSEAPN